MKEVLKIKVEKPQYVTITGITYAQVDSWYGHCRRDLKLDLIYPEDFSGKTYPCVVWICGGAWLRMDKSAHLSYLSKLAQIQEDNLYRAAHTLPCPWCDKAERQALSKS